MAMMISTQEELSVIVDHDDNGLMPRAPESFCKQSGHAMVGDKK
jgi:hypothetical protein